MSAILLILNIIGILLLCLIGILLLLILLVLFSPVRYIVNGRIDDKHKIDGSIHWLWPALSIPFSYEYGAFLYEFRIFGIRTKKKRGAAKNENFGEEDGGACEEEVRDDEDVEEAREDGELKEESREEDGDVEGTVWGRGGSEALSPDQKMERRKLEDHKAFYGRSGSSPFEQSKGNPAARLWKRIRAFFHSWKESWRRFLYTVTHIRSKIGDIKKLLTEETNKKVLGFGFQELKYLLRHFRFRKVEIDLAFSLGDPSYTGQVLGVLCLFPVLYRYEVHIKPDFESEQMYAKGTFYLKGHMRTVHFAAALFRLWKKKEFRTLIKSVFHKN